MNFSNLPVLYSVITSMNDKLTYKVILLFKEQKEIQDKIYTNISAKYPSSFIIIKYYLILSSHIQEIKFKCLTMEALVHSEIELLRFVVHSMGMRQVSLWVPVFLCQSSFHKCSQTSIIVPEMCGSSNQSVCYHSISPQLWLYVWPGTWSRKI
jgi:hypothetical protein